MNCTRIAQWLPLYASADLSDLQLAQVSAHLAQCERCAAEAAEFAAAREWAQNIAAPDFDEAFFADLRYAVRQELAATPVPSSWWALHWRPLVAATAAVLLLTIFSLRLIHTKGVPRPNNLIGIVKTPASPQQPDAAPPRSINRLAQALKPRMARRNLRAQIASAPVIVAKAEPALAPEPLAVTPPAEPEMLRIEMQTADPNIRIIWFAPKVNGASSETNSSK